MAVGYGGDLKFAGTLLDVQEWSLDGERAEINASKLRSEDYECLPGVTKHYGTCTLQWNTATKTFIESYFLGAGRTRGLLAFELIVSGTEKKTGNCLPKHYRFRQKADDLIVVDVDFTVSGALTHA